MRVRSRVNWIALGITLSLVLPCMGSLLSTWAWAGAQFPGIPQHSLVEACGGLMAIAIAGILLVESPRKAGTQHYPWMAAALIGMGVLDLFHAAVVPGNEFIWLHSTATLIGGTLFAGVWLSSRTLSRRTSNGRTLNRLVFCVLGLTLAFGVASCVSGDWIPSMQVDDGAFSPLARRLNIGGGVGFLLAGAFFIGRFHQRYELEDWLFAAHTMLFGAAAILFEWSILWDTTWWWWHILRLLAYLAALAFAIRAYLDAENELFEVNRQLNEINRHLDRTVEERTATLSHERFLLQTLLDHLPDAIYFKDIAGRFTRVSRSLALKLGRSPVDVVDKRNEDVFSGQYSSQVNLDEAQVIRTGQPLIGKEEQPGWAGGSENWVSTTRIPLPDKSGQIIGTFGISHDITAQKQSEVNFRRVIDAAPNPLVVVDDQGNIELVNAATSRLFGYEKEELIGQPVELLVPDQFREEHTAERLQYLRQPSARAMAPNRQVACRRKNGSVFSAEIGLNPVQLNDRIAVLASVFDITTRLETERALIAAKQAAESANRAKSEFLANMSHEIRTPMNGIIGMADLLLRTTLDARQLGFLNTLRDSANLLLRLLNDILDLSKIEAGRLQLEIVNFSISDCIARAARTMLPAAEERGLELICRISPEVPLWLQGDPGRLQQVLLNLIGNAVKFTETGEVFVDVNLVDAAQHARNKPKSNAAVATLDQTPLRLYFSVRDTGIGIPPEKQQSIFMAFEQAESSTTRRFGGTGLGLSISSQLVSMMRGEIGLNSLPGKGSTFHFTAEFLPGAAPEHAPRSDLKMLERLRALVVDDNLTNRKILGELLGHWGMQPVLVEDAKRGIQAFQQSLADARPFQLVLLDHNMPHMSGLQLAERLRQYAEWKQCLVLMLSSSSRPAKRQHLSELGIDAFLQKPVIASELLDEILLQMARAAGQVTGGGWESLTQNQPPHHTSARPRRILLVEDNPTNQVVAQGLLDLAGHSCVLARNGQEALDALGREKFDLVLMDMQMPILDGREAIRRIRQQERATTEHQTIIALTAEAMSGDREKCLAAGADEYLSKPLTADRLFRMIEHFSPAASSTSLDAQQFLSPPPQIPSNPTEGDTSMNEAEASGPVPASLINWEVARECIPGGDRGIAELAQVLLGECGELMSEIESGFEAADSKRVARGAHTLKSSARYFGAEPVVEAALAVEKLGQQDRLAEARQNIAALRKITEKFQQDLAVVAVKNGE